MDTLLQDLRYAARALLQNRGFTAVAVVALALGIGANTAIFTVVNAVLLRPLPYPESERLVALWNRFPLQHIDRDWLSPGQYLAVRAEARSFEEVAVALGGSFNLTGSGEPERIEGLRVSASFLPMLGASPALGRVFGPEEDQPGAPPVALIGNGLWRRHFGADANVTGATIYLDGQPYTVVGVLPPGFSVDSDVLPTVAGIDRADVVLPVRFAADAHDDHGRQNYNVLARLRPAVTVAQAQAEVDAIAARLMQVDPSAYPAASGFAVGVAPLLDQTVGDVRPALLVLLGAVGLVLLIACANVANLLLARGATRRKEVAVRAALGAGRSRLVRQFLTESVLLGLLAGVAGLALAGWSVEALRLIGPENLPRLAEVELDGRVFAFTTILAVATGLIFGVAPALRASRADLGEVLKEAAAGATSGPQGRRLRGVLVVSEIALALVLLAGAGLLIRSFASLQEVDPGFSAAGVLSFHVGLPAAQYLEDRRAPFFRELGERLAGMPGVEGVGAVSSLPLSGTASWGGIHVEGYTPPDGEAALMSDFRSATPGYFATMEIPLLAGRAFDARDAADAPSVAVVDEQAARRFWPGQDPIGKRFQLGDYDPNEPWVTVVGVVGNVKQYALDSEARPALYLPHAQFSTRILYLVVRTSGDPASLTNSVTATVRSLDPGLPVYDARPMAARVADSLARRRFSMLLLGLFAGVALLLAVVGIYGVTAYTVAQRTREIGIRIALGARPGDVLGLVVRQGAGLTALGVAAGLAAALGLARLLSGMLYGVSAADPLTFAAITALLAGASLAATIVPARRAARVNPVIALKQE
jgi:predicted permease